jgi:hypothetical protein
MRLTTMVMIVWFAGVFGPGVRAGDKQDGTSVPKDDVYHLTLSDGSTLTIEARLFHRGDRGESSAHAALWPKDEDGTKLAIWTADLTSVDYAPETKSYYALVKVMEDRIFIFAMWNGRYCVIDRRTGRVLKKGEGDDVLREYNDLVPLRLTTLFIPPSTTILGSLFPEEQAEEREKEKEQMEREQREADAIAISYSQRIPGSKLRKFYVVQFDTRQDAHAVAKLWRPVFVIVWKAEKASVSLDRRPAIARISINGHSVTPPAAKRAIYAIQPDYSLQQLSLTEEEITRLFSHITTRIEKRETALRERGTFPLDPSDPYWEQKVDPHRKIVELPQNLK